MKRQPEYFETSIWYREEIMEPYQIFAEFFSAADLAANRKIIHNLLLAANSTKTYNKSTPGDLLFHMRLIESLINAAYLINQEKRKSPLEISNYELFNPNLFRGDGDISDWDFIPRSLSLKEYINPYVVFKRFFKFQTLAEWKTDLRTISEYALVKTSLTEACIDIDTLSVYFYLTKLIEAAHLIDVREITHIGGRIKNKLNAK